MRAIVKEEINTTDQRREDWDWDCPEQKWYHKPCDVYAGDEHKCIICGAYVPDSFRWQDVMTYIEEKEYDQDEYFSMNSDGIYTPGIDVKKCREALLDSQVFDDLDVWQVAVYWVNGSSEGWYVHIDQVLSSQRGDHKHDDKFHARNRMLGKFWSAERAAEVCSDLAAYIWNR